MAASRSTILPGVLLSAGAAAVWLAVMVHVGPNFFPDSLGYFTLADALQHLHVVSAERPDRTPGYAMFLLACRGMAAVLHVDPVTIAVIGQTILLSGLGTFLVYRLATWLTDRVAAGSLAALLFSADVDCQGYGCALLTEALTVVLALGMTWWRVRDGDWRRAAWLAAALALTRPNLVIVPLALGTVELLAQRPWAALTAVWPTAFLLAAWLGLVTLGGTDPRDTFGRVSALCTFGAAYEASLWQALPDGPPKQLLAVEAQAHHDAYQAATRVTGSATPWNPPTSWQGMRYLGDDMVRADPWGYVLARVRIIPLVWQQRGWTRLFPDRSRPWVQWLAAWRNGYREAFYASFPLFIGLLASALWSGFGWPAASTAIRLVIGPYVAIVLLGTAALSLGSYDVGRLGISLHPFTALLWALALTRVGDRGVEIVPLVP